MLIFASRQSHLRTLSFLALFCLVSAFAHAQVVNVTEWHSGLVTLNEGWLQQNGDQSGMGKTRFRRQWLAKG